MVTASEVRTSTLMMFVGAVGIAALGYATMSGSVPSILAPYSLTVVLPYFNAGRLGAILIWPIVFLVWGLPLFARARKIPAWSAAIAAVLWFLGVVWLAIGARAGLVYQGVAQVVALAVLNVVLGGLMFWLFQRGRKTPSFAINFVFHWLIVAWLTWGAMPWLGEGL